MEPAVIAHALQIPATRAKLWAPLLTDVCRIFDISTPQRKACFLAQIGHESGRLVYTKEIWGPTAQQKRYEPITTLSRILGNVHPGDGSRYRGRGLIETTGLANYIRVTKRLRARFPNCPDFVANPLELEKPFWAAMSAGDYWAMRNLNKYADAYDFARLTKAINGGYNGIADRKKIYVRALPLFYFSN